jgi:hypothetical protein
MTQYSVSKIEGSDIESIKTLLEYMCKENRINQKSQDYKILFSNEKVFNKHNSVLFTSGSKKYLSFYGKLYSNKKNKISETIYLEDETITFEAFKDTVLIISGGVNNSTNVEDEENILYFYIAPRVMLDLQEPGKWQDL